LHIGKKFIPRGIMLDKSTPTFDDTLYVVKDRLNKDGVVVYAIVRDAMFFLPAFLDHYRKLGVRSFFFLDDNSNDGTLEYLLEQSDCTVAGSARRYSDRIAGERAPHVWKSQIPHQFLLGRWALCADADEFLCLPPSVRTLDALTDMLNRRGATAMPAVMVDFYPRTVEQMESFGVPRTRDELFRSYPWFDAGPYFHWAKGERQPNTPFGGVRARLLSKYRIAHRRSAKSRVKKFLKSLRFRVGYGQNISKVPLVKWRPQFHYRGAHSLNMAPDTDILLPIAHFKFTANLPMNIESAITSGAYSGNSRAYFEYSKLIDTIKANDGTFLGANSVRFEKVEDFRKHGLMKFKDP